MSNNNDSSEAVKKWIESMEARAILGDPYAEKFIKELEQLRNGIGLGPNTNWDDAIQYLRIKGFPK